MKTQARLVLTAHGWLARQPPEFRDEVLTRGVPSILRAGEMLYRMGDPPGGIFGLVAGRLAIFTAPAGAAPLLPHLSALGQWFGEGGYLTGDSRRVAVQAVADCAVLSVGLDQMQQMAANDPHAARRFGQIAELNLDLAIRVVHDLLIPDRDCRIAAVLARCAQGGEVVPLRQDELGAMANASRKQVNAALRRLAARGWVEAGYRAIRVLDAGALDAFARRSERD